MTTAAVELSLDEIDLLLANLDQLTPDEQRELLQIAETLEARQHAERCRDDLIAFCQHMQGDYKVGTHHKQLAGLLMQVESGEKDRITVSIAPRHGKSQLTSIYFSAWFLGRNPNKQVMLVSHTGDLAVDFGRKVRNLIDTPEYRAIFPTVALSADSKSAGRWNTNAGGVFYATGVGSSLAGRGADLLLIDDPHSEQDILNGNFDVFEKAYSWYTFGARTRLMPNGRVAIIATRWHQDDLIGKLIRDMTLKPDADRFDVVEFPAILNEDSLDPAKPEKALWPAFFPLEALKRTKASMPLFQWNAQYQQNPTSEGAAIVKREWWQRWQREKPPKCEYIIMALDAAAETHNRADYTSITTWGVWKNEEADAYHLILLNSIRERYEYPELKRKALIEYKDWEPDAFIVEKKSSGTPLYQELRRTGIMVQEYTPHRGSGDKVARLNSVADIIQSGIVWVPETRWAEALVEEVASFPVGSHDDMVDTTIMALMRFRSGGFITLPTDEAEAPVYPRKAAYY